jgi:hypothetical protein
MSSVSIGGALEAGTKTTVFTAPERKEIKLVLLFISNHTGNNKAVSAWWYDKSSDTEIAIIDGYDLDAKKYIQFGGDGAYVVLEGGDEIRIQTENSSSMTYIITFEVAGRSAITTYS